MTVTRNATKILIARQICISQGLVWVKILAQPKLGDVYLTLAENIIATVERQMLDFVWPNGDTKDGKLGR